MNFKVKTWTIGAVVAELPEASEIFDAYGIDFCCGGNRLLADVIAVQGIDGQALYEKLNEAQQRRSQAYKGMGTRFTEMEATVLSTYIEDTHHVYLRTALPQLADLLYTVLRAHGKNHRELYDVYRVFGQLKGDLEQHLLKEESLLFPAFAEEEYHTQEIGELSQEIITEHEAAGDLLAELRKLTGDYLLPEDACTTFHRAYEMLKELESDLHQHIHLENNILLRSYDKRATA